MQLLLFFFSFKSIIILFYSLYQTSGSNALNCLKTYGNGIFFMLYDQRTINFLKTCSFLSHEGWEVAGDHIQSGAGGSDNDYLILNLHIPGFK